MIVRRRQRDRGAEMLHRTPDDQRPLLQDEWSAAPGAGWTSPAGLDAVDQATPSCCRVNTMPGATAHHNEAPAATCTKSGPERNLPGPAPGGPHPGQCVRQRLEWQVCTAPGESRSRRPGRVDRVKRLNPGDEPTRLTLRTDPAKRQRLCVDIGRRPDQPDVMTWNSARQSGMTCASSRCIGDSARRTNSANRSTIDQGISEQ